MHTNMVVVSKMLDVLAVIEKMHNANTTIMFNDLLLDQQKAIREGWLEMVIAGDLQREQFGLQIYSLGIRTNRLRILFHEYSDFRKAKILGYFKLGPNDEHRYTFDQLQAFAEIDAGIGDVKYTDDYFTVLRMMTANMFDSIPKLLLTEVVDPETINKFIERQFTPDRPTTQSPGTKGIEVVEMVCNGDPMIVRAIRTLMHVRFFVNRQHIPMFEIRLPSGIHVVKASHENAARILEYVKRTFQTTLTPIQSITGGTDSLNVNRHTPMPQYQEGISPTPTPKVNEVSDSKTTWKHFFTLMEYLAMRGEIKAIPPANPHQHSMLVMCFESHSSLSMILSRLIVSHETFDKDLFDLGYGIEHASEDGTLRLVGHSPQSIKETYGVEYIDIVFSSQKKLKDLYQWMT